MFQRLLEYDARWSRRLRVAEQPGLLRRAAIVLAHSGDSWFWLGALILVAAFGSTFWRWWAVALALAILITAVIVLAVKFTVRRQRPAGEWGALYRNTDPHSFPSGHAARVFLLAALVFALGPVWLAWILAIWAPLVALARVAMGVHYLSDVLVGALLGLVLAAGFILGVQGIVA
ncbi:MAG: phosphatase PAP2 family protein [Anaerolineales bacterium]